MNYRFNIKERYRLNKFYKMPMNFDLEAIRARFNCETYLETGLYDTRYEAISVRQALKSNFTKVYSVELLDCWIEVARANEVLIPHLNSGRLTLIKDDSTNLKNHLVGDDFSKRTLFFLDAHVDNGMIRNFKTQCPLVQELDAIKSLNNPNHIILIDDVRCIKDKYPWGDASQGDCNWLDMIFKKLLEINPNYIFKYLNGHIENDVLMAFPSEF